MYYLGPGRSPGYTVVDVGARYRFVARFELFVQVKNALNRRYYTAAQLGPTGLTERATFAARPFAAIDGEFPVRQSTFFAPGAPRTAFVGTRMSF
jgi:outer membrane receptor protein involved in Fe transport